MAEQIGGGSREVNETEEPRNEDGEADAASDTGLSLFGEEGERVADTLVRLAIGEISPAELNDARYRREAGGTLRVEIDDASFRLLTEDDG